MTFNFRNYFLGIYFLFFIGTVFAQEVAQPGGDKPSTDKASTDKPSVEKPSGEKIVELNKQIKEKREAVATCQGAKKNDPECKKAEAELDKLRSDREGMLKNWPEGKGLRKKVRREVARDRMKVRREKAAGEVEVAPGAESTTEDSE